MPKKKGLQCRAALFIPSHQHSAPQTYCNIHRHASLMRDRTSFTYTVPPQHLPFVELQYSQLELHEQADDANFLG